MSGFQNELGLAPGESVSGVGCRKLSICSLKEPVLYYSIQDLVQQFEKHWGYTRKIYRQILECVLQRHVSTVFALRMEKLVGTIFIALYQPIYLDTC